MVVEPKNLGALPFRVSSGDRVAQLVVLPLAATTLTTADNLDDARRGPGGVSSTGV